MAKVFRVPSSASPRKKQKRVSVKMPPKMLIDLDEALARDGYSKKQQSKWVNEALNTLFQKPNYLEIAAEEWSERGGSEQVNILLDEANVEKIKDSASKYRQVFGVERFDLQSKFIRSAIIQRVIG